VIAGLGVDIIEIDRIRRNIAASGDSFLRKLFTDGEIAYCSARHNAAQHFAARFAAKEAVSKAMATGWAGEFAWKDVEIANEESGRPVVTLHGPLRETLAGAVVHVSLSHSETHVVAVAVIERERG
jgi:holo-[acyl-carrier protein] synthase